MLETLRFAKRDWARREGNTVTSWVNKAYQHRYQYWSIELAIPKIALRDYPEKIREEIDYFVENMKGITTRHGNREAAIKVIVLLSEYVEDNKSAQVSKIKTCKNCGIPLWRGNKTGYCRGCVGKQALGDYRQRKHNG
jgi:hypothetical protein